MFFDQLISVVNNLYLHSTGLCLSSGIYRFNSTYENVFQLISNLRQGSKADGINSSAMNMIFVPCVIYIYPYGCNVLNGTCYCTCLEIFKLKGMLYRTFESARKLNFPFAKTCITSAYMQADVESARSIRDLWWRVIISQS